MKITELIKFDPKEDYIRVPHGKVMFYKVNPPNVTIMSYEETLFPIRYFRNVLRNMPDIPLQVLAIDRTEDLRANKAYWKKTTPDNAFIGECIIDEISKSNANTESGVQRGFYLAITVKDVEDSERFESTMRDCEFSFEKQTRQENINILRAFLLRDFQEFPIEVLEEEISTDYTDLKKSKQRKQTKEEYRISEIAKRLLPTNMNIKSDMIEQSNFLRQVLLIKNLPMSFDQLCLLRKVAQIKNTTLSMRISQMNRATAISLVDKQMKSNISTIKNKNGTQQLDAVRESEEMNKFFEKFRSDEDKMLFVNIYIEMYGETKEKLNSVFTSVKSNLEMMSFELLRYEQKEGFLGVCPLTQDKLHILSNNVPGTSLAALYPFSYSTKTDTNGMYLGQTADGGYMFVDFRKRTSTVTNGNYFIGGESGYGKSYLCKKIISQFLAHGNVRAFIFDYENEYSEPISNLGGVNIDATDVRYRINPLQVRAFKNIDEVEEDEDFKDLPRLEAFESKAYLSQHLSWLKDFLRYVIPHLQGKDMDMMMALIKDMYYFKGITDETDFKDMSNEEFPTFTDLYKFIEIVIAQKSNYPFYKLYSDEMIAGCLLMVNELACGSLAPMFNGHTTLPTREIININLQELVLGETKRTQAYLFNMMTYMWSKVILKDMDTLIHVDELYLLCDKDNPMAIQYLRNFEKRARKYNAYVGVATQQLADVSAPEIYMYTSALFNTPSFKFLFNPGALDIGNYKKLTRISDSQVSILQECSKKECLVFIGKEVYKMIVGTLSYEKSLFGTAGGQ